MRKIFLALVVLGVILGVFAYSKTESAQQLTQNYFYKSVCAEPIYFKIGKIDPRFGLSENDVLAYSKNAADIWNTALDKKLFAYSPTGTLTINMVYDYRQSLNTQIDQIQDDLNDGKTSLAEEERKFKILSANFDERNKAFIEKVAEWNRKQNGSQEEYNRLLEEQQSLRNEAEKLNLTARQLNLSASKYNDKITDLNQTIGTFNNALEVRPEEGIYDPNTQTINIYFNNDQNELTRTIAHEMGHARGLGHLNDINAIMYPKTTKVLVPSEEEIALLNEICEPFPIYKPYVENFKNNLNSLVLDKI